MRSFTDVQHTICALINKLFGVLDLAQRDSGARKLEPVYVQPDGQIEEFEHTFEIHDSQFYLLTKRIIDLFLSIFALVTLSPLMLTTMLAIIIDDPKGGPIFTQTRIGHMGKPFRFYKFRSMCVDAEAKLDALRERNEMDGPVFKIKDDPRITRVGKFIRRYSIDELPQLVNIIKGEMSIVGPRPPLPNEVQYYNSYEMKRLAVVPGLSCWWQISGRNNVGFDEWMKLDMQYVEQHGLFVDAKIVVKTFGAVLGGKGAA